MQLFKIEIDRLISEIRNYILDNVICILHSLTVGFAEQNGRDAERAVARLD